MDKTNEEEEEGPGIMSFISLYIPFNVEINSLTTAILGTIFPTIPLTLFKKEDILVSMSFLSFISV